MFDLLTSYDMLGRFEVVQVFELKEFNYNYNSKE